MLLGNTMTDFQACDAADKTVVRLLFDFATDPDWTYFALRHGDPRFDCCTLLVASLFLEYSKDKFCSESNRTIPVDTRVGGQEILAYEFVEAFSSVVPNVRLTKIFAVAGLLLDVLVRIITRNYLGPSYIDILAALLVGYSFGKRPHNPKIDNEKKSNWTRLF
jgi:hypothetical protein